tara:strand:- start:680 stop:847 length:168 start_codon:yes stop_codon:yes gene_type:complete
LVRHERFPRAAFIVRETYAFTREYYRPPEKKTEEEEKESVNIIKVPTIFKLFLTT